MNKYEVLYIIDKDVAEEAKEALVAKFQSLVETLGGNVTTLDKWGLKRYTYPINFKDEGYYVLMLFEADGTVPLELDRQMRITDGIVRNMIVRK